MNLNRIIKEACNMLRSRQEYARDVLRGRQRWSGADLQGKARRYGGGYARQRKYAAEALYDVGGCIVALRQSGRLLSAVYVGMDDYGTALYELHRGILTADALRKRSDSSHWTHWPV